MTIIRYDALNRVSRIIQQTYLDWTTQYCCYAISWTSLSPTSNELEIGRGWSIMRTENIWTNEEITRRAKNLSYPKTYHWGSSCEATDLATVQAYDYA